MTSVNRPTMAWVGPVGLYPGEILDRSGRKATVNVVRDGAADRVANLWEGWGLGSDPTDTELDRAAMEQNRKDGVTDLEYFAKDGKYYVQDGPAVEEINERHGASEYSWVRSEGKVQADGRIRFPHQDRAGAWELDR